ncbi:hypothetical protein PARPLA_02316 [Rhodobacteraceae bacterium THAF1]|uniref:hypothetical protein n=1 Tax=Palleronia sp. THAF1 TaxID=2587842 RepID=UPI000F3F0EA4|nr:hypothetical protein [Palleronia sp. THAF1]QFU09350.1 hypothetical protein FIU81_11760 [Palleronia sp. THAF1]VDC26815.1 hypothetical protein PARPLA_02316 [Rhodobacteraceae bacterium THAF1]
MTGIWQAALAAILVATIAGCAPTATTMPSAGGSGPQFEPGDPCMGVVPELCANPGPVVNRTPGDTADF